MPNPFIELPGTSRLLSLVTFLPLVGVFFVACLARFGSSVTRAVGLVFSASSFVLSLVVWNRFQDVGGFQFVDRLEWMGDGLAYALGIDGISLLLVMLTTLLTPLALMVAKPPAADRVAEFTACVLALETAVLGALLAIDLVLFYVFWEAMLVPMYLLIGVWGGARRAYATTKFFLYAALSSILMLTGVVFLCTKTGLSSTAFTDVLQLQLTVQEQRWLFAVFGVSFAIRLPLFPLHTWLPDAQAEAPTTGSVLLTGLVLNMGAYGLLRLAFPLFPVGVGEFSSVVVLLAVVSVIYGAFVAHAQSDMRKAVAYFSLSHFGLVVLGMFALTQASVEGALLQLVSHGISTGGLMLCLGMLYERRGTNLIADYGGLAKSLPVLAVFFMVMILSCIGLPGTSGFVGEFLIFAGTWEEVFSTHLDRTLPTWEYLNSWRVALSVFAGVAVVGFIFVAVYMLSVYRRIMFGQIERPENSSLQDLNKREIACLVPLAVLVFLIGFWPNVFLGKMHASVEALVSYSRPQVLEVRSPEPGRSRALQASAKRRITSH